MILQTPNQPIFGINRHCLNKVPLNGNFENLSKNWQSISGIEKLAKEIKQGYATMAGLLQNAQTRRLKTNVIGSYAVFLDIDEGLTLSEVLTNDFIQNYCSLIYTSASHQKEKNGLICDRFRLVFQLPDLITNIEIYEQIIKLLMEVFPNSDKACKDASRIFYGNTEAQILLLNPSAYLPSEWIEKAQTKLAEERAKQEELKLEKERQKLERLNRKLNHNYDGKLSSWEQFLDHFQLPVNISVDLTALLGKSYQDSLTFGAPKGERNKTGFSLCREILAVERYLQSEKQSYSGDVEKLMTDYGIICGLSQHEINSIINSAQRYDKTPSVNNFTEDGIKSKIASIVWKTVDKSHKEDTPLAGEISEKEYEEKFGKNKPDLTQEYYVSSQQWQKWLEEEEKSNLTFELKRIFHQLPKTFKKGFGWLTKGFYEKFSQTIVVLPSYQNYKSHILLPSIEDYKDKLPPKIFFKQGERLELINKLIKLGWTDIADTSFMGSGKSHDLGFMNPDTDSRLWYFDKNHNNVSTLTIKENYENLYPRHNGMYQDSEGNLKIARTEAQRKNAVITPNCHRADLFNLLTQKNYNPNQMTSEGNLNPICATCPSFNCKEIGYRGERRMTFSHDKIRLDINSAPLPDSINYSKSNAEFETMPIDYAKDTAIIEESGSQLNRHKTLSLTIEDIDKQFAEAFKNNVDLNSLRPFLLALNDYFLGKNHPLLPLAESVEHPLYGINSKTLLNILPLPPLDIETIINNLISHELNLEEIVPDSLGNVEKEYRSVAKTARAEMLKESVAKIEALPVNGLVDLLKIWAGKQKGFMKIVKVKICNQEGEVIRTERQLKLTIEDPKHQDLFSQFKTRIYLDATFNRYHTAKILGINPNQIIEIQEELPSFKNLTVYNTHIEGLGSNGIPSEACQERLKAYNEYVVANNENVEILGFKSWGCENYWFNHNRGTNKFKGKNYLLTFGLPYPNIGDKEDEYNLLFENEDEFNLFYEESVRNEVIQNIGRQRFQLYPEQNFILDLVSTNSNLDWLTDKFGIKVINQSAINVVEGAGSAKQKARQNILDASMGILNSGKKLTQQAIASLTKTSQQNIQQVAQTYPGGWKALKLHVFDYWKKLKENYNHSYIDTYRGGCNFDYKFEQSFREWLNLNPLEAVEEFVEILTKHGWEAFKAYLDGFSDSIQATIIGLLTPIFAPEIAEVFLDSGG